MRSNEYIGKEGTDDGDRPLKHCNDKKKTNKKLHKVLIAQPKGQRVWTAFAPENHRHIYPVFETILIDAYELNQPVLPELFNDMSGESIDSHVKNYKIEVFSHLHRKTWYHFCCIKSGYYAIG